MNQPKSPVPVSGAAPSGEYKMWQCELCAFSYDEAEGLPAEGIPPRTRWEDVPDTWTCPDCSAVKGDFRMLEL